MANNDEQLSPGQRGKIRRLSQPRELAPDEEGGELNIVPFLDIIVNILIFVLATVAVIFTASIETNPPASGGSGVRSEKNESLNLTVLIVNEGFSLKTSGGNVAPGCQGAGPGIAIPMRGARYDYGALTDCVARLKKSSADFKEETQASLAPNPATDFQTIVRVMDALRGPPDAELFPDINFKVAK